MKERKRSETNLWTEISATKILTHKISKNLQHKPAIVTEVAPLVVPDAGVSEATVGPAIE